PWTWRSSRHVTGDWPGERVPEIANGVPTCARRLSSTRLMCGITCTSIGPDSTRGRVASPAKTARILPLDGRTALVVQLPSGPQVVVATCVQAEPAAVYSIDSAAPAGLEPSAKCSTPLRLTGVVPCWLDAARTPIPETGPACAAAIVRR